MKEKKIGNIIFFTAYFLYVFFYILFQKSQLYKMVNIGDTFNYIEIFVILLLLFKLLFIDNISVKRSVLYSIILFICIVNANIINTNLLLVGVLFVLTANDIEFKDFLKKDIILKSFLLIFIILLCFLGIIPNFVHTTNGVVKYSLGFRHPNFLCPYFITLILEYICLKGGIKKKIHYLYFFIAVLIIYLITRSRTSILALIMSFIIYLVFKNSKSLNNNKYVKRLLYIFPIAIVIFNFILIVFYAIDFPFIDTLNNFFSGRIKFAYEFLGEYNITLFGQDLNLVDIVTAKKFNVTPKVLDMAFVHLLLNNGVLIFLIFVVCITIIQYYSINNKNYELMFVNIFFILTALSEVYIYNFSLNFVLILLLYLIDTKRGVKL